jgi:hypothetical protein
MLFRDVFGDTSILGDHRWAGAYGIDADFIAGEHCSVARIRNPHIQAPYHFQILSLNDIFIAGSKCLPQWDIS